MRLSKLQKRIITEIAKHMINSNECANADGPYWVHIEHHEDQISRSELLYLCVDEWDREVNSANTIRVSYSRALRSLHNKGLIGAFALAWYYLEQGHKDFIEWQGGGRKRGKKGHAKWQASPVFRAFCLTDEGWRIARDLLGPDVGKCNHLG